MATKQTGQPEGGGEPAGLQPAGPGGQIAGGETKPDKNPIQLYYKCMLGGFVVLPLLAIFAGPIIVLFPILLIIVLGMGIWAWRKAKRQGQGIRQDDYIVPALVMPVLLFIGVISLFAGFSAKYADRYRSKMFHIKDTLWSYTQEYEGQWPDPNQWCDVLMKYDLDVRKSRWFWPEGKGLEFAMNAQAGKLGRRMPGDMVLLFRSWKGWNQTGGMELIPKDDREEYIIVLFGDGQIKNVKRKNVAYLKWKLEDSGIIPKRNPILWYGLIACITVGIAGVTLASRRKLLRRNWIRAIIMSIIGMGAGGFFGAASAALYPFEQEETPIGWMSGIAVGLMAGLCFVAILGSRRERLGPGRSLLGYGTLLGAGLGIFSAAVVHGLLSVRLEAGTLWPLLSGCGFGVYAGTFAGMVGSWLMTWRGPKADAGEPVKAPEVPAGQGS